MFKKIFFFFLFVAVSVIQLTSAPQKPCPNNDIPCLSKFFAKNGKCDLSDNNNLNSVSVNQVFDIPPLDAHIERRITIKGMDKASVKEFTYDPASGVATLQTLIPAYSADVNALVNLKDDQNKMFNARTTFAEALPSFVLTTVFKNGKLDLASSTSSMPQNAVPNYTNLSHLKNLQVQGIAAMTKNLKQLLEANGHGANAASNNARAKTLSEIVVKKIIC